MKKTVKVGDFYWVTIKENDKKYLSMVVEKDTKNHLATLRVAEEGPFLGARLIVNTEMLLNNITVGPVSHEDLPKKR